MNKTIAPQRDIAAVAAGSRFPAGKQAIGVAARSRASVGLGGQRRVAISLSWTSWRLLPSLLIAGVCLALPLVNA